MKLVNNQCDTFKEVNILMQKTNDLKSCKFYDPE